MNEWTVRAVCQPDVAAGFALAGVPTVEAADIEEAAAALRRLLDTPGVGVVLVQESVYDALAPEERRALGRRPLPMVVPFPGPVWGEALVGPEAQIVEILRQAIGYRVRLR